MKKGNPEPNSQARVLFLSGSGGGEQPQNKQEEHGVHLSTLFFSWCFLE